MVNINLRPWYKHNLEHHIAYLPSSQHVQGSSLQNKKCISTKSHQNLTTNCIICLQIQFYINFEWLKCKQIVQQLWVKLTHLSTAVAWREKKSKHFVFYKYFCLILGLLKSRISEKNNQPFLNKLDFKLFHYKARVQLVS